MGSSLLRTSVVATAIVAGYLAIGESQTTSASWLNEAKLLSWNKPGAPIPAAPKITGAVDSRCQKQARPPQLDEDKRLTAQGWDLVGAYQGGWEVLVIRATAGYDGMCRPRQYQDFVFVRGAFAGTLSPHSMDSRTDGALSRVFLQSDSQLSAEYQRYAAKDPLCCPSRTTTVVFELAGDPSPVVRPVSASSTPGSASPPGLAGTSWQLVKFQGGDGATLTPDDRSMYTIELAEDGALSARIDCNRGRGSWKSSGPNQIEFGPMALTRAMCPPGSLHDHIVKQWSHIRSFVIRDGHLFLSLRADGGIYEFEPVSKE
jgi:heat shock protein HslJ